MLARGALAVVDALPLPSASWLVRGLADLWFVADRERRSVAVENILASGIAGDREAAVALARRASRHFAQVLVESLKSHQFLTADRWQEHVTMDPPADVAEVLHDPRRGLLVASAHLGNWEVGAQVLSGFKPTLGAARRMSNPYVHRLLERRKPRFRYRLTSEWGGRPTRFLAALRRGEALALLIDLDARGSGIQVDFFGRPASTHTTVPMLHMVGKAPLCMACCLRVGTGRFEVRSSGLFEQRPTGDREADARSLLERLHRQLEAWIREVPEQYVWAHSRWKHGRPRSVPAG